MLLVALLAFACPAAGAAATAASAQRAEAATGRGRLARTARAHLRALSQLAARRGEHRHGGHSDRARRGTDGVGGAAEMPATEELVSSLEEVAKGLESEQGAAKALANSREGECKKLLADYGPPRQAIRDGERLIAQATDDLQVIGTDVVGLESTIGGVKTDILAAKDRIDELTRQLKDLRDSHRAAEKMSVQGLQQLDAVIARSSRDEELRKRRRNSVPEKLNTEVFNLQRLGRQLADSTGSSPAFLQIGRDSEDAGGIGSAGSATRALLADKQDLLRARVAATRGFDEQEKEFIRLIEAKRDELMKLEANLQEQQPILADKLRQSAEANRTLAMAKRVLERDRAALQLTGEVCELQGSFSKDMNKLRFQAIGLVKMPAKLLYSMDTAMFLARDLQELKAGPPTLVQLGAKVSASARRTGLGQAVQEALRAAAGAAEAAAAPLAIPTPAKLAAVGAQGAGADSMLQQGTNTGAGAGTGEAASGPFDKVTGMLRTLIASLREQANQDTDLHQWCLDSASENDRTRIQTKAARDQASSEILWAESAIAKLEGQVAFFQAEISRLKEQETQVRDAASKEERLLDSQLEDHKAAKEVLLKVVDVLKEMCDLEDSELEINISQMTRQSSRGTLLLQKRKGAGKRSKSLTKRGQCAEAARLILQSVEKIGELDSVITQYLTKYGAKAQAEATAANEAANQRARDLTAAKAAKSLRAHELATAQGDRKQKESDLELLQKAASAIEQKCSVKETHEERMARRQDEIDALKSAYKVLNGEEIPVESSLVSVSSSHHVTSQ